MSPSKLIGWLMSTVGQFFLAFAFNYVILQLLCMCKDHAAMIGHASATAHVQDTMFLSQVPQINDIMSDWCISVEVQSRSTAFNSYFHLACFVTVTTVDVTVLMKLLLCNHLKKNHIYCSHVIHIYNYIPVTRAIIITITTF